MQKAICWPLSWPSDKVVLAFIPIFRTLAREVSVQAISSRKLRPRSSRASMERETHTLVLDTVADTGRGQGATRSLKFWVYPPGPRRPPGFLGFKKNQNCDKLDFDPTDPRIFWEPPSHFEPTIMYGLHVIWSWGPIKLFGSRFACERKKKRPWPGKNMILAPRYISPHGTCHAKVTS